MIPRYDVTGRRAAVDSKLTDLALYAKELCPGAMVEASPLQYEDYEDEEDMSRSFRLPICSMPR